MDIFVHILSSRNYMSLYIIIEGVHLQRTWKQYPELFEAIPKPGRMRIFGNDFLGGLVKG